jgi:hypothetical protein
MIQNLVRRYGPFVRLSILCFVALGAIRIDNSATAALIGVSLSYDGSVKVDSTTGVEAHDLAPVLPPNPSILPVTNGPLTSPLQSAQPVSATINEQNLDIFMGMQVRHAVITINGTGGNTAFINPIDADLTYPVQFDGTFYSSVAIPAGQMIQLAGIGIEDGDDSTPFPTSADVVTSGIGTQANPWNIHIGIPANLVNADNGYVKVHLYYKFGQLIPEPTTLAIVALAGLPLLGLIRRRRHP